MFIVENIPPRHVRVKYQLDSEHFTMCVFVMRISGNKVISNPELDVENTGRRSRTTEKIYKLHADGREEPVRGLEFVGVDRRVLRDIVAAGRTSAAVQMLDPPGTSSRYEAGWFEGLPVSWAVPPVLIDELELHSRSGGEPRVVSRPQ